MGTWSSPGGKERPGRDADPSPTSSAVVKKGWRYTSTPPLGSYGLYRASVPVQGCTLPLPFTFHLRLCLANVLFPPPSFCKSVMYPTHHTFATQSLTPCFAHRTVILFVGEVGDFHYVGLVYCILLSLLSLMSMLRSQF